MPPRPQFKLHACTRHQPSCVPCRPGCVRSSGGPGHPKVSSCCAVCVCAWSVGGVNCTGGRAPWLLCSVASLGSRALFWNCEDDDDPAGEWIGRGGWTDEFGKGGSGSRNAWTGVGPGNGIGRHWSIDDRPINQFVHRFDSIRIEKGVGAWEWERRAARRQRGNRHNRRSRAPSSPSRGEARGARTPGNDEEDEDGRPERRRPTTERRRCGGGGPAASDVCLTVCLDPAGPSRPANTNIRPLALYYVSSVGHVLLIPAAPRATADRSALRTRLAGVRRPRVGQGNPNRQQSGSPHKLEIAGGTQ